MTSSTRWALEVAASFLCGNYVRTIRLCKANTIDDVSVTGLANVLIEEVRVVIVKNP
jgi:hypothetical protein